MKKLTKRARKNVLTVEKYACHCGCSCFFGFNESSTRQEAKETANKIK
ncbi:TPA: hypothetical protein ACGL02_000880 [Streptococcus agalactiae]|nr:hypothetical protein [Finegoldia magna]MCC2716643.1 hypothetical protein [Finegoldia magna]HBG8283041.1 hypothetical protein [Clostridioides difficile]HEN9071711.1 hypothetical protein [Streptococcus agalactiae]